MSMDNKCLYCGEIIPEGWQVCPSCAYNMAKEMEEAEEEMRNCAKEEKRESKTRYNDGYMDCLLSMGLTADEYQELAARTISDTMTPEEQEMHALHGMVGEIGELHSLYQKVYQGHDFDLEHAMSELGDLMWFAAEWCTAHGVKLSDVMQHNIDKLIARYPDGFEAEKSLHRAEGDI